MVSRNVVDVPILQPHIPLPDTMVDRRGYTDTYVSPPLNKGKPSDLNRDDSMGGNPDFILKELREKMRTDLLLGILT